MSNLDSEEIKKFDDCAEDWWDPNGSMKALHHINPWRLAYIQQHCPLQGLNTLDVGCGAGLLSEAMARQGAKVTGIDPAQKAIDAAKHHAEQSRIMVDYVCDTIETFAEQHAAAFDMITCLEMLEHVPDPAQMIQTITHCLKPGGKMFLSTINRNLTSFLGAIVGAEYVLGIIPKGTHHYQKLIRPSELTRWAEAAHLTVKNMVGMRYNPWTGRCKTSNDVRINYIAVYEKQH